LVGQNPLRCATQDEKDLVCNLVLFYPTYLPTYLPDYLSNKPNKYSDNNFIGAGLGGMGYSCRSYKKQFRTTNLLKVDSKPIF
jgi:hypothetical protein